MEPLATSPRQSPPPAAGTLGYAPRVPREPVDRVLLALLAVAIILRLAFGLARPADVTSLTVLPDQVEYLMIGDNLRHLRGAFFDDTPMRQWAYAFRLPGYPLLCALCGNEPRVIRVAQTGLDTASLLMAYLIGRQLGGRTTGRLAAALVAVNPYLIYFSTLILSETLFTTMLITGVWLALRPQRWGRHAAVLVLLLSVYVRPSAIGLGLAAAPLFFYDEATGWRATSILKSSAIAVCALIVLLFPWALRNRLVLGDWVWTTTNGGYTAYDSFNPVADGSSNQAPFRLGQFMRPNDSVKRPLAAMLDFQALGEVGRSRLLTRMAVDYARSHPARALSLAAAKLGRFWTPVPLSADFGGKWYYVAAGGAYVVPLFVLAAVGVWRGGLGRQATLILLLPALYFSAVHCVFVGSLRYRVPCDVPLAVLAAAGATSSARRRGAAA